MGLSEILKRWYYYDVKTNKFNYISEENPTTSINPEEVNVIWYNKKTGEIFICINNTPNKNVWKGTKGTIVAPSTLTTFDIFKDNSAIALWTLDGHVNDLGGNYNGVWDSSYGACYDVGKFGQCACCNDWRNRQISFNIPELEKYDIITISAWVWWNGRCCVMPFGFKVYDIYVCCGYLGFNTGSGDVYGFDFRTYLYKWTHIVAEFHNGEYGKIWINGNQMPLQQAFGGINKNNAKITSDFHIFGWGANRSYRNFGKVDQVRMFNRALNDDEVQFLYHEV